MNCTDCNGTGKTTRAAHKLHGISYPEAVIDCFMCNGTGEMCDVCGEAINVCEGMHDDDE